MSITEANQGSKPEDARGTDGNDGDGGEQKHLTRSRPKVLTVALRHWKHPSSFYSSRNRGMHGVRSRKSDNLCTTPAPRRILAICRGRQEAPKLAARVDEPYADTPEAGKVISHHYRRGEGAWNQGSRLLDLHMDQVVECHLLLL